MLTPIGLTRDGHVVPQFRRVERRTVKTYNINIPMISRSSVTIHGDTADAHKGIWFYDPALYGHIAADDVVVFGNNGEQFARGIVTEIGLNPEDFPKFCSGMNRAGFRWVELENGN
jgi:hypothetical protein